MLTALNDLPVPTYHPCCRPQAEDWYKSGGRLLVDVARQVSRVRRPEEARQLQEDIGQFLVPGAQEQTDRLETAAGLAHQLFGETPGTMLPERMGAGSPVRSHVLLCSQYLGTASHE